MQSSTNTRRTISRSDVHRIRILPLVVLALVVLLWVIPATYRPLSTLLADASVSVRVSEGEGGGGEGGGTTTNTSGEGTTTVATNGGYVYPPKIFGHLHYAKTAGTEINGELAAHYERVCGHKGWSFDAYQFKLRYKEQSSRHGSDIGILNVSDSIFSLNVSDSISKLHPTYNRGRVPPTYMKERGFEDCDWISVEQSWNTWAEILPDYPIELHVPCRDPIQHLMSQCNYKLKVFDCNSADLQKEIDRCLVEANRFHRRLQQDDHVSLKCFNPIPIDPYLDYMGTLLQRKRIETDYVHRDSNRDRNLTAECIWNRKDILEKVGVLLRRMDYYKFCSECMGSEDDVLRSFNQSTTTPTR